MREQESEFAIGSTESVDGSDGGSGGSGSGDGKLSLADLMNPLRGTQDYNRLRTKMGKLTSDQHTK